jgi:hypothetical protein
MRRIFIAPVVAGVPSQCQQVRRSPHSPQLLGVAPPLVDGKVGRNHNNVVAPRDPLTPAWIGRNVPQRAYQFRPEHIENIWSERRVHFKARPMYTSSCGRPPT